MLIMMMFTVGEKVVREFGKAQLIYLIGLLRLAPPIFGFSWCRHWTGSSPTKKKGKQ